MVRPSGYWKNKENRIKAVKDLVNKLSKPPNKVTRGDFENNNLWSLLVSAYSSSPFRALKEASLVEYEWEMQKTPNFFWNTIDNRKKATIWLVKKLGKRVTDITQADFRRNGLGGLIAKCRLSPYKALKEAGYEIEEWQMSKTPNSFWKIRDNRIRAIRWLVKKEETPPTDIEQKDFQKNNIGGILNYYSKSHFRALKDAGFDIEEWQMKKIPNNYWKKESNRIRAIRRLVRILSKDPSKISQSDFKENKMGGLLDRFKGSPFKALKEAGFVKYEWEMETRPNSYWKNKKNRVSATRRLVEKLGKPPEKINRKDFEKNRLHALLNFHGGPYRVLLEAGFKFKEWERDRTVRGTWKNKEKRVEAIRSLVHTLNKDITEISQLDFVYFGWGGLINSKYYGSSPYRALSEAGYEVEKEEMKHYTGGLKYTSNHGDPFRSMAERDLDNEIWKYGLIDHQHNVPYIPTRKYNCDFVIGEKYWIEYAGRIGKDEKYDSVIEEKKKIAIENEINLIIITPNEFYSGTYKKKINHIINEFGSFNQSLMDFL